MILLLSAVALTGCDTVRAGTRCKAGAAPGRDATHVLFCQGGKWKRVMTIGQAADFILGTIPGAVTPVNATATVKAGDQLSLAVAFTVTSRTGKPLPKAKVTLNAPSTGAGLVPSAELSGVTGDDGRVWFPKAVINNALGSFTLTAKVDGSDVAGTVAVTVVAGEPAAITIVSGQGQTATVGTALGAPMSARVTDARGNPVSGKSVGVYYSGGLQSGNPPKAVLTTDANGVVATTLPVSAPTTPGSFPVYFEVERTSYFATFNHTVVVGAPSSITPEGPSPLTAVHDQAFADPLTVLVKDVYGNPVPGATASFTVVPAGGATAVLSASTAVTGADGRASVTATAGSTVGTYQVSVAAGSANSSVSMQNT